MIDILHTVCNGVAFRMTEPPLPGDVMDASKARLLDGRTPLMGDIVICGTCGQPVDVMELRVDSGR